MSKCGCLDCRGLIVPFTRKGWKALKNKHGRTIGLHPKPRKATQRKVKRILY